MTGGNRDDSAKEGGKPNRPSIPSFGFFAPLPILSPSPSARAARPIAAESSSSTHKAPAASRRNAPLSSPFAGFQKHGDVFVAPYDRYTLPPAREDGSEPAAEVTERDFYQAILEYQTDKGKQYHGAFVESGIKFQPEVCATAPGAALRFRDRVSGTHHMLDFDLHEFEEVSALVFSIDTAPPATSEALERAANATDSTLTSEHYFRFCLKKSRKHINQEAGDYAIFADTTLDWNPTKAQAECHDNFTPYMPQLYDLPVGLEEAMHWAASAEEITVWVSLPNADYLQTFRDFEHIIQNVACLGREPGRFRFDWYWSKHDLYATQADYAQQDGDSSRFFDRFWHRSHVVHGKIDSLSASLGFRMVTATNTSRSGARSLALLWEMESSARAYNEQFSPENKYFAAFEKKGKGANVLVKVKLSGPKVTVTHNGPQVVPAPGSPVKVLLAGESADEHVFQGRVAEKTLPGFDFVLNSDPPRYYHTHSLPSAGAMVTLAVSYENYQDISAIEAISAAAMDAENMRHHNATLDARRRARFQVFNHVGGKHVAALSPDFYQDWCDQNAQSPDFDALNDIIAKVIPAGLNVEQCQAYLLALRGSRAAMLGLEGCPGTGKSHTLRAIAVAMLLMGYSVFISAQSNNGVDAVFEKIVRWASAHRPDWIAEGKLLRLGASSIDFELVQDILRHWQQSGGDADNFDSFGAAIQKENIPHSAAYKMTKHMHEQPGHAATKAYTELLRAKADQRAKFEQGPLRTTDGVKSGPSTWELMDLVIGEPRLVAATAAASRREIGERILHNKGIKQFDMLIFDEASQATEASFMLVATAEALRDVGLVILGGDHKQLPPVINSKEQNPFGRLLEISPLERLIKAYRDRPVVNLVQNYRSHPQIVELDSAIIYDGKMVSGKPDWQDNEVEKKLKARLSSDDLSWGIFKRRQGDQRVFFIDTPGFSEKAPGSSSSWNPNGVNYTARLASMISRIVGEENVQVITMCAYEVGKIRSELATYQRHQVHVQTVDSFQGKEDEAVVVHCSAAWKERHNPIGFLTDARRLNVAISRAKSFMFIVGNLTLWEARMTTERGKKDRKRKLMFKVHPRDGLYLLMQRVKSMGLVVEYPADKTGMLPKSKLPELKY